jgi:hypothetical protein
MVKEVYYALKGDSLQIRREDDDANMISSRRGLGCLGVAMEYNL